jgi:hypothetical protein
MRRTCRPASAPSHKVPETVSHSSGQDTKGIIEIKEATHA